MKKTMCVNKKILMAILLLFAWIQIVAVPALNVRKQVVLEDGTVLTATLGGDEYYCYYTTDDGRILTPTASGKYRIVSEHAHAMSMRSAEIKMADANGRRAATVRKNANMTIGEKRGIVILAQFQDVKFSEGGTQDFYSHMFNDKGFHENGCTGSVSEYFYDQSYGKFKIDFDVVGPVTLPNTLAYYGGPNDTPGWIDIRDDEFVIDACLASADLADFSQYDWDNDGTVDIVYIIFAGYSQAEGGGEDCIWPHNSILDDKSIVIDGVNINGYSCSNELLGGSGQQLSGIGVICHEFSHALGLNDTYDLSYRGCDVVEKWDLMATGAYLGKGIIATDPIGYNASERWQLGWLEPRELNEPTTVTGMQALEDSPEAYILYNEGNRDEYYMLENRQLQKWGHTLGAHGLMVTHVDYDQDLWQINRINIDISHPRFSVVSAANTILNKQHDLFPGSTGNTSLTDTSIPASTLFNANSDGTYYLNKAIENISESSDGTISFVACTDYAPTPTEIQAVLNSDGTLSCSWEKQVDAESYEVELTGVSRHPSPYSHIIMDEKFTNVPRVEGTENISNQTDSLFDNTSWNSSNIFSSIYGIRLDSISNMLTPLFQTSATGDITFRIDMKSYNSDLGYFYVSVRNQKNREVFGAVATVAGEERNTCHIHLDAYKWYNIFVLPFNSLCISRFSIHDGIYEYEDFEREPDPTVPDELAPEIFTTNSSTFHFDGVREGYNYKVRLRSHHIDGRTSQWSRPVTASIATGVNSVNPDFKSSGSSTNAIYDLTGRRVVSPSRPGIYLRDGKKIIVR